MRRAPARTPSEAPEKLGCWRWTPPPRAALRRPRAQPAARTPGRRRRSSSIEVSSLSGSRHSRETESTQRQLQIHSQISSQLPPGPSKPVSTSQSPAAPALTSRSNASPILHERGDGRPCVTQLGDEMTPGRRSRGADHLADQARVDGGRPVAEQVAERADADLVREPVEGVRVPVIDGVGELFDQLLVAGDLHDSLGQARNGRIVIGSRGGGPQISMQRTTLSLTRIQRHRISQSVSLRSPSRRWKKSASTARKASIPARNTSSFSANRAAARGACQVGNEVRALSRVSHVQVLPRNNSGTQPYARTHSLTRQFVVNCALT